MSSYLRLSIFVVFLAVCSIGVCPAQAYQPANGRGAAGPRQWHAPVQQRPTPGVHRNSLIYLGPRALYVGSEDGNIREFDLSNCPPPPNTLNPTPLRTIAGFTSPWAIVFDKGGNMYVSDTWAGSVVALAPPYAGASAVVTGLSQSSALADDPSSTPEVLWAINYNDPAKVQGYELPLPPAGATPITFRVNAGGFTIHNAQGLTFSPAFDYIAIGDVNQLNVSFWSNPAKSKDGAGNYGDLTFMGVFNFPDDPAFPGAPVVPTGMTADPAPSFFADDGIFVADWWAPRIYHIGTASPKRWFDAGISRAQGIDMDQDEELFVASNGNGKVLRYNMKTWTSSGPFSPDCIIPVDRPVAVQVGPRV